MFLKGTFRLRWCSCNWYFTFQPRVTSNVTCLFSTLKNSNLILLGLEFIDTLNQLALYTRLICEPLAEHPSGQQREPERSARKSSGSEQARTQTSGRAGGDWQQSTDTTGFEEEGNCILSSPDIDFQVFSLSDPCCTLKTGSEGCTQGGGCG